MYRGAVSQQAKPVVEYRPIPKRRRTDEQVKEDLSVLDEDGRMTVGAPTKDTGPATLWERPKTPPTVVDTDP